MVSLIVAGEVGFWVVLAAGLGLRYGLRLRRAGAALLVLLPVVDLVILAATVADLRGGAVADWTHGLAASYVGFSVAYGHYLVRWADGHAAHRRGLEAAPLPVDHDGAVVSELGSVGAVLLTPAHQFPLGSTLSPQRRRELVAWARSTGGAVVEDDYDGEFRYDRRPVGALQALAPEHVVYAGTASKSLAPGVRLGWLVVPGPLLDPVLAARAHGDWPSAIDQLTLAELIASGGYDRHVRRVRIAYRRRRDRLLATVHHVTGIDAGLHAVVELDEDEADVVERARRHDLIVEGLDSYRFGSEPRGPALVVGYGTPPEHAWEGALGRLREVVSDTSVSDTLN